MNWKQLRRKNSNSYLYLYLNRRRSKNFRYEELDYFTSIITYMIISKVVFRKIINFYKIKNIRVRFFKGCYHRSHHFLIFCKRFIDTFFPYVLSSKDAGNFFGTRMGWFGFCLKVKGFNEYTNMQDQFFDILSGSDFATLDSYQKSIDFRLDDEFDWLVNSLIDDSLKFYYYGNGYVISKIGDRQLILNYWKQDNFSSFFSESNSQVLGNFLVYNLNKGVNINSSVFQSWQNVNRVGRVNNVGVTNRVMSSFQVQFDYAAPMRIDSYISEFNQIHWFNPIFQEMYNLPFFFTSLRPGFNNSRLFERLEHKGVLHKAAVYHLNVSGTSRFIFDRYLYDHAKLLVTLPYKHQLIPQLKYIINFGSVVNPLYFNYLPNKIQIDYFKNFKFFYSFNIYKHNSSNLALSNGVQVEIFIRRSLIIQIMLNFWNLFDKLKTYFETINFTFYPGFLREVAYFRRDPNSGVFFGIFDDQSFDRVTRRLFFSLSKFLNSSSIFILLAISAHIKYQKGNVLSLSGNWETLGFNYVNTLTEFEKWYRDQEVRQFLNKSIFESWFFDFLEQFYDYELWLYTYFQSVFSFLDILILAIRLLKFFL